MKCSVHRMLGKDDVPAEFVLAGFSICDDEECWDAVGATSAYGDLATETLQ